MPERIVLDLFGRDLDVMNLLFKRVKDQLPCTPDLDKSVMLIATAYLFHDLEFVSKIALSIIEEFSETDR